MSSKDFITRYFEQLGKVLAAILGFRENKQYELAEKAINQQLNELFYLTNEQIMALPTEELIALVFKNQSLGFDVERSVAELIYQMALTYEAMNQTDKMERSRERALSLFQEIDLRCGYFSVEIQERIVSLNQKLTLK